LFVAIGPLLIAAVIEGWWPSETPGTVYDEAQTAGRPAKSLAPRQETYFAEMDAGVALSPEEAIGRDTWMVWTGGNDRFWDTIARNNTFGTFDLLKTLSSYRPKDARDRPAKYGRHNRWQHYGLVNEPCFEEATGPDPERFDLWLDKRITNRAECEKTDPFDVEKTYPGVAVGARGQKIGPGDKKLPIGSFYGYASGVVGLRLFPNPDFDEAARKKWDPERYYTDETYYRSKDLVRPYRVGMSCGFCHVGPNPRFPPEDPENPKWGNLSSIVGAQYIWFDRVFTWESDPKNFIFQLLHTNRPGTFDTSLESSDYINNPRTMNAVYGLGPRLNTALRWGKETLAGDELQNRQLPEMFADPQVWTPRVLKDGSDAVGALGALARVYLNIGLFSEEWLLHFRPFFGGRPITPIRIEIAHKNSTYWRATVERMEAMAHYLVKASTPPAGQSHRLEDVPRGRDFLTDTEETIRSGRRLFADYCARCHSSKIPAPAPGVDPGGCAGPDYLTCWKGYWAWTKTPEFKEKMHAIVDSADFLTDNFLSTDIRVPVTLVETNACASLQTNAIKGNIWDSFSSQTYKQLPSVGEITVQDPFTGVPRPYSMPGGGRGYLRPPSLIALWSTAPYFLNNGLLNLKDQRAYEYWRWNDPSLEARMYLFRHSIEQLLWPERRQHDSVVASYQHDGAADQPLPSLIDRTTARSYFVLPLDQLPGLVISLVDHLRPHFIITKKDADREAAIGKREGVLRLGPIPINTPVALLSNIEIIPDNANLWERIRHYIKLGPSMLRLGAAFWSIPEPLADADGPTDEQVNTAFQGALEPLLKFNKCPDFVVNRGHYFGTGYFPKSENEKPMTDKEKEDLIAFLKTL
jgi:hypothetical protein